MAHSAKGSTVSTARLPRWRGARSVGVGALAGLSIASAAQAAEAPGPMDDRTLVLVGVFIAALLIVSWIASMLMGDPNPPPDEDPYYPIDFEDEEDLQS